MKTYIDHIGGEICIGYTIGQGADREREIQSQEFCIATFSPTICTRHEQIISIDLSEFKDSRGRTIGDLLAERGEDVFKIIDQPEEP